LQQADLLVVNTPPALAGGVFTTTVAVDARASMIANTIHTNTFTDPVNTVKVWGQYSKSMERSAAPYSNPCERTWHQRRSPGYIADKFERAQSAGYGEEDLAALIKVFR
jgi:hypothetical protein